MHVLNKNNHQSISVTNDLNYDRHQISWYGQKFPAKKDDEATYIAFPALAISSEEIEKMTLSLPHRSLHIVSFETLRHFISSLV